MISLILSILFVLFIFLFYLFSVSSSLPSMTITFFFRLPFNVICIRISIVFKIPFIIVWWYLFNNFIYNCLSSFYFICFVYFYFSIKVWKFFHKFFITYYACWFAFKSSAQSISKVLWYCFYILYFRFLFYSFLTF